MTNRRSSSHAANIFLPPQRFPLNRSWSCLISSLPDTNGTIPREARWTGPPWTGGHQREKRGGSRPQLIGSTPRNLQQPQQTTSVFSSLSNCPSTLWQDIKKNISSTKEVSWRLSVHLFVFDFHRSRFLDVGDVWRDLTFDLPRIKASLVYNILGPASPDIERKNGKWKKTPMKWLCLNSDFCTINLFSV